MDLNVRAVFNMTKRAAPLLERAATADDPARVINVASVDGVRALQTSGPHAAFAYTVSKGAVVHLTSALCRALSPRSIAVNCIVRRPTVEPWLPSPARNLALVVAAQAPGLFPSNSGAPIEPTPATVACLGLTVRGPAVTSFMLDSDGGAEQARRANPLGRVGRTADAAGAALFLASPASAWVNGVRQRELPAALLCHLRKRTTLQVTIPIDGGGILHDHSQLDLA